MSKLGRFFTGCMSGEGDPSSSSVMKITSPSRALILSRTPALGRAFEDRGDLLLRHGERLVGHHSALRNL